MKYFLIAGETSGDLHASRLMFWLKHYDPQAQFRYFGGDYMKAQGGQLIKHYKDTAFMGIVDVLKNLNKIKQNLNLVEQQLRQFQPDVVILVDYPGFNLRVARIAKNLGLTVFYYISPKIWAWNKRRAYLIKKYIDKMFVIFPFEVEFYKQYDYQVEYLGNPTLDEIHEYLQTPFYAQNFYAQNGLNPEKIIIALLPGSRQQEVQLILPFMVELAVKMASPDYQFAISAMSHLPKSLYKPAIDNKIPLIWDASYDLLRVAYAAVVTSGTATLETALFGVPQVVVYKTYWWQYYLLKPFVHIDYFSLVNIILGRKAVEELLQKKLVERTGKVLNRIIYEPAYYQQIKQDYHQLRQILGQPGAARRTAKRIVELLSSKS